MDNIIQNEVIYEAHAPKGLRFSPAIVEEAKSCAVLTYEERKATTEEIASPIQSLKDEIQKLGQRYPNRCQAFEDQRSECSRPSHQRRTSVA